MKRLFHFSDDGSIAVFEPRPVRVAARRRPGEEWLNGPLVWAIDGWQAPMYLFPRDCPRILMWPLADTTESDRATWWGARRCRMRAWIENAWLERMQTARLWRYELPAAGFESLDDAGMHVAREAVVPIARTEIAALPAALAAEDVELTIVESLTPLRGVWETTLHASGIRLRNAAGW